MVTIFLNKLNLFEKLKKTTTPPTTQEMQVQSLGWEDPLEEKMATPSSILVWKTPWTGSLVGYSPWVCSQTRVSAVHTINNQMKRYREQGPKRSRFCPRGVGALQNATWKHSL